MSELGLFSEAQAARARERHVIRTLLVVMELDGLTLRLHPGWGRLQIDGDWYYGVSDPGETRVVTVSGIEVSTEETAPIVYLTMTGVDADFVSDALNDVDTIRGRPAHLYVALFDDDYQPIGSKVALLEDGRLTSPRPKASRGVNAISIGIESSWAAKNFAPGLSYSPASHEARNPGDHIGRFVSSVVVEEWP